MQPDPRNPKRSGSQLAPDWLYVAIVIAFLIIATVAILRPELGPGLG